MTVIHIADELGSGPPLDGVGPSTITFGARVRKSPYFGATLRYGAKAFSVYNHMYMPLWYESPEADFQALIDSVTVWDVSVQRQVEIVGPDAGAFMARVSPRNLSKMLPGRARYVLFTDDQGGVLNDPVVLKLAEDRFWLSLADSDLLLWMRGLNAAWGLDVQIREPDVSPIQIQGPKSTALMMALFGSWIEDMGYYHVAETTLDGIPLVISRTGWSAERGYEIYLTDGTKGDALWERVFEAGRPFDVRPGAPSTIRRIEGGILSYGSDITAETNPYELNLGRLVDVDRPDWFVGKAALTRIHLEGISRRLVGFEIDGPPIPVNEHPWSIRFADDRMEKITSAVYSPRLDKNIALGFAPMDLSMEGTEVMVEIPGNPLQARIVPVPFYDPNKAIARN